MSACCGRKAKNDDDAADAAGAGANGEDDLEDKLIHLAQVNDRTGALPKAAGDSGGGDEATGSKTIAGVGALSGLHIDADGEQLEWLNRAVRQIWPFANAAIKKLLQEWLAPMLNESLPRPLNTVVVEEFFLGNETPVLGPISAYPKKKQDFEGFEFDIYVNWKPYCDIRLKIMGVVLGIKSLELSGLISLALRPLMAEIPIVGGLQIFMINPPDLSIEWAGAATVVDFPLVAGAIRGLLNQAICDVLVLPNRIFVPIAEPTQVDMTKMQYPRPEAIVRVQLHSGKGMIAKDFSFFGQATSDPYVIMKVGANTFKSTVIKKTLNPVWKHQITDFFMFNKRQCLNLTVFDQDLGSGDDLMGKVIVQLDTLAGALGKTTLKLELPDPEETEDPGTVELELTTLVPEPFNNVWQIPEEDKAVSGAPQQHVALCSVQVQDVRGLPRKFARDYCYVSVETEEDPALVFMSSAGYAKEVSALLEHSVPQVMQAMLENLHLEMDLGVDQLSAIGDLPPKVVEEILRNRPSFDTVFNYGCHFLLKKPRDAKVLIKLFVRGNTKLPYAIGECTIGDVFLPGFRNMIQLKKTRVDESSQTTCYGSVAKLKRMTVKAKEKLRRSSTFVKEKVMGSPKSRQGDESPDGVNLTIGDDLKSDGSPGAATASDAGADSPAKKYEPMDALEEWDERANFVTMNLKVFFYSLRPLKTTAEITDFYNEDDNMEKEELQRLEEETEARRRREEELKESKLRQSFLGRMTSFGTIPRPSSSAPSSPTSKKPDAAEEKED